MARVGDTVAGFTLAAEADVPATGAWFLAESLHEGRPVFVRVRDADESGLVVKLAWERLRKLDHPSAPRVVGWSQELGVLAVTAPIGVTLDKVIEHRHDPEFSVNPGTVLDVGEQLGSLLVHAHERGRPHGHITPGRMWLSPLGELVVWGYGDGPSREPEPAWAAPERARDQRASGDADQWALAALLSALVTGRVPWRSEDPLAEARVGDASHLSGPVNDQWKPLGRIVTRALAADPRDRFPSVHPIHRALRAMAERVRQPSGLARMGEALAERYPKAYDVPLPSMEPPTTVDEAPDAFDLAEVEPVRADVERIATSLPDDPAAALAKPVSVSGLDLPPLPEALVEDDGVQEAATVVGPDGPASMPEVASVDPSDQATLPVAATLEDEPNLSEPQSPVSLDGPSTLGDMSVARRVDDEQVGEDGEGFDVRGFAPWIVTVMLVMLVVYLLSLV